jgi:hypothetical protein
MMSGENLGFGKTMNQICQKIIGDSIRKSSVSKVQESTEQVKVSEYEEMVLEEKFEGDPIFESLDLTKSPKLVGRADARGGDVTDKGKDGFSSIRELRNTARTELQSKNNQPTTAALFAKIFKKR